MADDDYWYEAAFVVGITNALNVVADGLVMSNGEPLISPVSDDIAPPKAASAFAEIREFYDRDVPVVFRLMARDPIYLAEFWAAVRRAFLDNQLTRRLKESIAFAVSLTTRSNWGAPFHLAEMRRFGVTDRGVMEIVGMTQVFSSYTKIADTLQLQPDMGQIEEVRPEQKAP
jgi:AhpD family alkylhydroperoxidase